MKYVVVRAVQGATPLNDELDTTSHFNKTEKRAEFLKNKIDNFISKLPFAFDTGDYSITIKDIKLEAKQVGIWFYAKRNGEFIAAHSPFWVVDCPLFVELSHSDDVSGDVTTRTTVQKEDLLQSYIDTFIRYLDTCELGEPIGDDVSVIYVHNDGDLWTDGLDVTFANLKSHTPAGHLDYGNYGAPGWTCSTTNNQYATLEKTGFIYDTSTLSGKTITAITNTLHTVFCDPGAKGADMRHIITQFSPTDNQSLVVADADNFSDTLWSDRLYCGTGDTPYTFTWTAAGIAGINKAGYTSTFIREEDDVDGAASVGWVSGDEVYTTFYMLENGTDYPYLTVTSSPTPTFTKGLSYAIAQPLSNFHAQRDGTHIDVTWS